MARQSLVKGGRGLSCVLTGIVITSLLTLFTKYSPILRIKGHTAKSALWPHHSSARTTHLVEADPMKGAVPQGRGEAVQGKTDGKGSATLNQCFGPFLPRGWTPIADSNGIS